MLTRQPGVTVIDVSRCSMGDKSPKSKDKNKKQGDAQKQQTKAVADAKRTPANGAPVKKGK
jgi:hypothetical protein